MKCTTLLAVAALAAPFPVSAQAHPNLNGTWSLVSATGLPTQPPAGSDVRTLTLTSTEFVVARLVSSGETRATYKLDGSESRNTIPRGTRTVDLVSHATWEGERIVIKTDGQAEVESYGLNAEGQLVREIAAVTSTGPRSNTFTYEKKPVELTVIPDAPSCATCRITVKSVATLDLRAHGQTSFGSYSMAEDARGRFWVPGVKALVFDAMGIFVGSVAQPIDPQTGRPWGVQGVFPVAGDSVLLYSLGPRWQLAGPDLQLGRMVGRGSGMNSWHAVPIAWPETVIVAPTVSGPSPDQRIVHPYTALSFAGASVRKLEADFGYSEGGGVVRGKEGQSIWTWNWHPYAFHKWSSTGDLLASFERQPGGAPLLKPPPAPGGPPSTYLRQIRVDESGLIWTAVNVPAENWEARAASALSPNHITATLIEVIDPVAARVLASTRIDVVLNAFLEEGRAAVIEYDASGTQTVRVIQLSLERR